MIGVTLAGSWSSGSGAGGVDTSQTPSLQEPALVVSVDEAVDETDDLDDETETPYQEPETVVITLPPDAPADADLATQVEVLTAKVKALEEIEKLQASTDKRPEVH